MNDRIGDQLFLELAEKPHNKRIPKSLTNKTNKTKDQIIQFWGEIYPISAIRPFLYLTFPYFSRSSKRPSTTSNCHCKSAALNLIIILQPQYANRSLSSVSYWPVAKNSEKFDQPVTGQLTTRWFYLWVYSIPVIGEGRIDKVSRTVCLYKEYKLNNIFLLQHICNIGGYVNMTMMIWLWIALLYIIKLLSNNQ